MRSSPFSPVSESYSKKNHDSGHIHAPTKKPTLNIDTAAILDLFHILQCSRKQADVEQINMAAVSIDAILHKLLLMCNVGCVPPKKTSRPHIHERIPASQPCLYLAT